jgi:hypothetical protein
MVDGRSTTIRKEWDAGHVRTMTQGEQRMGLGHKILNYFVIIIIVDGGPSRSLRLILQPSPQAPITSDATAARHALPSSRGR